VPDTREEQSIVIREALLQQFPLGTPDSQIVAVLEQHGLQHIAYGSFPEHVPAYYTFDEKRNIMSVVIKERQGKITFPCNTIFVITFFFSTEETVIDIEAQNESACL
jgi:hypothetical protein